MQMIVLQKAPIMLHLAATADLKTQNTFYKGWTFFTAYNYVCLINMRKW